MSALLHTTRETPNLSFNRPCPGPTMRTGEFVEVQFGVVCGEAEDYPSPTFTARGTFDQVNRFGIHVVSIW